MRHLTVILAAFVALSGCTSADEAATTTSTSLPTTTQSAPATTAPQITTSTAQSGEATTTFFFEDSGGNKARPGPFLVAVHDLADGLEPQDALEALLDGPPVAAEEAGIGSLIPAGTEVISIAVGADRVATVELSSTFDDGGGTASMFGRLAQLTYTLTALPSIDSVLLLENGAVVEVFSSEGIVLDGPMRRDDFLEQLPGILVESPAWGAPVSLPFEASGTAAAFEAVFQAQLLVDGNAVFDPPFVMSESGVGFAPFTFEVDADVVAPTRADLRVWEFSAEDGSVVSERFVPVAISED
jgi:spore germination protein GerM